MALARRGSRIIRVDGVAYRWAVSPDGGSVWLVVERDGASGQRVQAMFDYSDTILPDGHTGRQGRSLTPRVVRSVIARASANGWQPLLPGLKPLRVDGEAVL